MFHYKNYLKTPFVYKQSNAVFNFVLQLYRWCKAVGNTVSDLASQN